MRITAEHAASECEQSLTGPIEQPISRANIPGGPAVKQTLHFGRLAAVVHHLVRRTRERPRENKRLGPRRPQPTRERTALLATIIKRERHEKPDSSFQNCHAPFPVSRRSAVVMHLAELLDIGL